MIGKLLIRDARGQGVAALAAVLAAIPAVARGSALGAGNLMAMAFEAVAGFVAGLIIGVNGVVGDLEGGFSFMVSGLGRARYALVRTSLSAALAAAVALASATSVLTSATPLAIIVTAVASSVMGALIGVSIASLIGSRGDAMAVAVAVWALLAIIYDVALVVADLAIALSPREVLFALLANPAIVARLAGLALVDPSLLTLGPPGAEAYKLFGSCAPCAIYGAALAWIAALWALAYALLRRIQPP